MRTRRHPAEHINKILSRVLSGMGAEEDVPVASKQEYQELACAAAQMVRGCVSGERKKKAAELCLQYLRLSLCAPVAADQHTNEQHRESV